MFIFDSRDAPITGDFTSNWFHAPSDSLQVNQMFRSTNHAGTAASVTLQMCNEREESVTNSPMTTNGTAVQNFYPFRYFRVSVSTGAAFEGTISCNVELRDLGS